MSAQEIVELGLLQVEHTNEEDPDVIAALCLDYIPGWLNWDVPVL